jgi:uncharacterized peroxidase-related enzyme
VGAGEQEALLAALVVERLDAGRPDTGRFDAADRALLLYAEKLTRMPAAVTADDVVPLRAAGFDDRAIHDACAIIAYFAFVNRIADGLGVELEGANER